MLQIIEQSHEEKIAMYMKYMKLELVNMLISCDEQLCDTIEIRNLQDVVNQRDLLNSFLNWEDGLNGKKNMQKYNLRYIDEFLATISNNETNKANSQELLHSVTNSVCPLCNGKGKREFPNCTPPISETCPACNGNG